MNKDHLLARGFKGFIPIDKLMNTSCTEIPCARGIYVIYREEPSNDIKFLNESKAGWFKKQNPTVDIDTLKKKWVFGSNVVYIGKAGSVIKDQNSNIRSRIKQYLDFGFGRPIGHWGGRYIWQIDGFQALLVAWLVNENKEPRDLEKEYIKEFVNIYGSRPFANINS